MNTPKYGLGHVLKFYPVALSQDKSYTVSIFAKAEKMKTIPRKMEWNSADYDVWG